MLSKITKKEIVEWIICFAFFFRQAAKVFGSGEMTNTLAGNIDPFYFIIVPFFITASLRKKLPKWFICVNLSMLAYAMIQFVVWDHINIIKMLINTIKIMICLSILYMSIKYVYKFDYDSIVEKCTLLFGFFTLYALTIGKNSTMIWRLNDVVNEYSLRRLMLFYLEPSELGFHLAVLIIFLVARFLTIKETKRKIKYFNLIVVNVIALAFAKPMGAICCLVFAVTIMILVDFVIRFKDSKIVSRGVIVFLSIVVIMVMYANESGVIMRVIDTFNGTDSSNSYRIGTANEILTRSFMDYKGLGCGFGNSGTDYFMNKYNLPTGIVNSFGRFVIETGVFGIIYLLVIMIILIYCCARDKNILKYGFLTFLILYQFFGSHFTNALIWWIYGFIISKKNVEENRIYD